MDVFFESQQETIESDQSRLASQRYRIDMQEAIAAATEIDNKMSDTRLQTLANLSGDVNGLIKEVEISITKTKLPEEMQRAVEGLRAASALLLRKATILNNGAKEMALLRARKPQTISFLDLPLEIRRMIYDFIVADLNAITVKVVPIDGRNIYNRNTGLSLMHTCVQAELEMLPMLLVLKTPIFSIKINDTRKRHFLSRGALEWFQHSPTSPIKYLVITTSPRPRALGWKIIITKTRKVTITNCAADLPISKLIIWALKERIPKMARANATGGLGIKELEAIRETLAKLLREVPYIL